MRHPPADDGPASLLPNRADADAAELAALDPERLARSAALDRAEAQPPALLFAGLPQRGVAAPLFLFHPGMVAEPQRGLVTIYGPACLVALRLWPAPSAKLLGAEPGGGPPSLAYSLFERLGPRDPGAVLSLLASVVVPDAVQAAIKGFCHPFEQLRGLLLIGEVPEVLELAERLPVLARALLLWRDFAPHRWRNLGVLKRILAGQTGLALARRALRWLRLPASGAFIERLRRVVHVSDWSAADLLALVATLERHPSRVSALRRVSPLSGPVIEMSAQLGLVRALRPAFFEDLVQIFGNFASAGHVLRAMFEQLAELQAATGRGPARIDFLDDLQTQSAAAGEALRALRQPALPEPPLEGLDVPPPMAHPPLLRPLRTADALEAEGVAMRHCLSAKDFRAVIARQVYFFAAQLDGERATLMLRFAPGGLLAVSSLHGPENAPVSARLRATLDHWVAHQNLWTLFDAGPSSLPPPQPCPRLHTELRTWGAPPEDTVPVLGFDRAHAPLPGYPRADWLAAPVAPRHHPNLGGLSLVDESGDLLARFGAGRPDWAEGIGLDEPHLWQEAEDLGWTPTLPGFSFVAVG